MKLFLTDYASYNNGTQFEFGHWVDLEQFSDVDEFADYIREHLEGADRKSPLGYGAIREEPMFTDYEDLPRNLYRESGGGDYLDDVIKFVNLDDETRLKVRFLIEEVGFAFREAMDHHDEVIVYEDVSSTTKYELFAEYFPEADKVEESCDYLEINYERFLNDYFYHVEYDGVWYFIQFD